jgi:hypothetical protein
MPKENNPRLEAPVRLSDIPAASFFSISISTA